MSDCPPGRCANCNLPYNWNHRSLVANRIFHLYVFQQRPRSALPAQLKREQQGKKLALLLRNRGYLRDLLQQGPEEAQELAPQHPLVARRALRGSRKRQWEGTSHESQWQARTCCKNLKASEQDYRTMKLLKRSQPLSRSYSRNRKLSKENCISLSNKLTEKKMETS